MLESIRRWLGSDHSATPTQFDCNHLAEPQQDPHSISPAKSSTFVCREVILDRRERVRGYEFSMGRKFHSHQTGTSTTLRRAHDDAMLHNLTPLGLSALTDNRFAFVRLSSASLRNPLLKVFSHGNTLVMINHDQSCTDDNSTLQEDLRHLEEINVRFGLTINKPCKELPDFLRGANLIEVETTALDGIQLKTMCHDFHTAKNQPKLVASKLQTSDDFDLCYRSGFDFFMGPYVSSHEDGHWHPEKTEINRLRVFEVLNMIRSEAEPAAIARFLRSEPVLTFKLLRYINSPGIGLLQRIEEIQDVIILLGRDRFYRWLSLLLFDLNQPGFRSRVLNEQALTRARFMETLAGRGRVPANADHLFITGLFSLLDIMMQQPLKTILKQISLPDSVSAALRGEPGAMRDALMLGIAVESATPDEIANAASNCGLGAQEITRLMIEALVGAQKLIAAGEPVPEGTGLMLEAMTRSRPTSSFDTYMPGEQPAAVC